MITDYVRSGSRSATRRSAGRNFLCTTGELALTRYACQPVTASFLWRGRGEHRLVWCPLRGCCDGADRELHDRGERRTDCVAGGWQRLRVGLFRPAPSHECASLAGSSRLQRSLRKPGGYDPHHGWWVAESNDGGAGDRLGRRRAIGRAGHVVRDGRGCEIAERRQVVLRRRRRGGAKPADRPDQADATDDAEHGACGYALPRPRLIHPAHNWRRSDAASSHGSRRETTGSHRAIRDPPRDDRACGGRAGRNGDTSGRDSANRAGRNGDTSGRDSANRRAARPDRDAPRRGREAVPDRGAARPDRSAPRRGWAAAPDRGAARPDRGAARPDRGAARPDRDAARPDRDAPRRGWAAAPDRDTARPDRDARRRHWGAGEAGPAEARLRDYQPASAHARRPRTGELDTSGLDTPDGEEHTAPRGTAGQARDTAGQARDTAGQARDTAGQARDIASPDRHTPCRDRGTPRRDRDTTRRDAICRDTFCRDTFCRDTFCRDTFCRDRTCRGGIDRRAISPDSDGRAIRPDSDRRAIRPDSGSSAVRRRCDASAARHSADPVVTGAAAGCALASGGAQPAPPAGADACVAGTRRAAPGCLGRWSRCRRRHGRAGAGGRSSIEAGRAARPTSRPAAAASARRTRRAAPSSTPASDRGSVGGRQRWPGLRRAARHTLVRGARSDAHNHPPPQALLPRSRELALDAPRLSTRAPRLIAAAGRRRRAA
jgi:hypothetical protein